MQGIDVFDMKPLDASRKGTEALFTTTTVTSFTIPDERGYACWDYSVRVWSEDLEGLCGRGLVLGLQDVEG